MQLIWSVVISAVPTVGKNNQQIMAAMSKQVKQYHKLFDKYCGSARLEAVLLVHIQVSNLSYTDFILHRKIWKYM